MVSDGTKGNILYSIGIEGVEDSYNFESSVVEFTMSESLLTPSLHTTLVIQDSIYFAPDGKVKFLDKYKGKKVSINTYKEDTKQYLDTDTILYRIDNRHPINNQVETYNMNGIDSYALSNARIRMAKYYNCKSPSDVVNDALDAVGASDRFVLPSSPIRNYNAANLYPYQIIEQQAEVALDGGDPSFVHFMTFENVTGKHNFRSIRSMASASPDRKSVV